MAYIVNQGMGGFLCPPTHPMHSWSVRDLHGSWSLESDSLPPEVEEEVSQILTQWDNSKPALTSPEVQDWIHRVLEYFHHCYYHQEMGERGWDSGCMNVVLGRDPIQHQDTRLGVHHIRQYYPDYQPTKQDFDNAYWGTKGT